MSTKPLLFLKKLLCWIICLFSENMCCLCVHPASKGDLSAGPPPEKEHSKFPCFFFPCRTGKLQWRHYIHGRMEPRASCATSARRSWISRSQESSVKTGSQTENQPQDLTGSIKCTLQFIARSFPECGCFFSLLRYRVPQEMGWWTLYGCHPSSGT